MFTVKVITDFFAAHALHALRGYQGDYACVHGHNWNVEVSLEVQTLDNIGIFIDFKILKQQTKLLIDTLDHQFLNEIKPFDKINPTTENLPRYLFQTLKTNLAQQYDINNVRIAIVSIWKTPRACVAYTE